MVYQGRSEVTPLLSAAIPDVLELQYELESKAAKRYATTDITKAFFSIALAVECRSQFAFTSGTPGINCPGGGQSYHLSWLDIDCT